MAVSTRPDVLRTLLDLRRSRSTEFDLLRIGVFGSAARDTLQPDSDVDVVVELAKLDLFLLVGIKQDSRIYSSDR